MANAARPTTIWAHVAIHEGVTEPWPARHSTVIFAYMILCLSPPLDQVSKFQASRSSRQQKSVATSRRSLQSRRRRDPSRAESTKMAGLGSFRGGMPNVADFRLR